MSHITTYTGKHFNPMMPEGSSIDIRDIAHALSMICRGNGHVKTFFSVGQHCLNCAKEAVARGFSQRVILACLLHDAGEAYLSDVPRPFKQSLPEYTIAEDKLLHLIYEKYLGTSLTAEEADLVKSIDDDLLYYDLKELLNECLQKAAPELHIALDYTFKSFEEVEHEYLEFFHAHAFFSAAP